ncbi:MAG: QueT transporter family protein [Ignavibacteriales bacterium]
MPTKTQKIARAGVIAALYAALSFVFAATSFGITIPFLGVLQFRPAEALTLLPILFPEAIPGIFVGCVIANSVSPLGIVDVVCGSMVSLLAAWLTWYFRNSFLAYLSPIILNSLLVSLYLYSFFKIPYWLTAISIGVSETVVIFLLGYPLIKYLGKHLAEQ